MALAFPGLPGIISIRGFGHLVSQLAQSRIKQKSATRIVIRDEDIHFWRWSRLWSAQSVPFDGIFAEVGEA